MLKRSQLTIVERSPLVDKILSCPILLYQPSDKQSSVNYIEKGLVKKEINIFYFGCNLR